MPKLRLKKLHMQNCMKVSEDTIEFPDWGFVLVTGSNLASNGALASSGSGKTTLGEMLSRALLGVSGRHTRLSDFCNEESGKGLYVKLDTELEGRPLVIEMGYKSKLMSPKGEALRFSYDGETPVERDLLVNTRKELIQRVGVSPLLGEWSVFINGDDINFSRLSQEDSVNLLLDALAQPSWTTIHKNARVCLRGLEDDVVSSTASLEGARKNVEDALSAIDSAEDSANWEKNKYTKEKESQTTRAESVQERITSKLKESDTLKAEIRGHRSEFKKLENQNAEEHKNVVIELNTARDVLATRNNGKLKLVSEESKLGTVFSERSKELRAIKNEPDTCSKCGKPWDKKHSEDELTLAQKSVNDAQDAHGIACDHVDASSKLVRDASSTINDVEVRLSEFDTTRERESLNDRIEELEGDIAYNDQALRAFQKDVATINQDVSDADLNRAVAVLSERKRNSVSLSSKIDALSEERLECEKLAAAAKYWVNAFSPRGIPNMVINKAIGHLNSTSTRVSAIVTGGTLDITYASSRKLTKGEDKPGLDIRVNNSIGSSLLSGNSKGESSLSNLIVSETMSEVGLVASRIGYRWYDEITNGQDSTVRRNIFSYLRNIAHEKKILVFVVDHSLETSSYADHILLAEKTLDQGTKYKWIT